MQQFAVDPEMAVLPVWIHRILAIVETERIAPVPVLDRYDVAHIFVAGRRPQALRPFRPGFRFFVRHCRPQAGRSQGFTVTRPSPERRLAIASLSSIEIFAAAGRGGFAAAGRAGLGERGSGLPSGLGSLNIRASRK
jgi:hypothetical protein